MRLRSIAVAACASSLAACGPRACGKTDTRPTAAFTGDHVALVAKNPRGVSLVLRTANGQARFAQGETIAVVLAFSSSVPDTYKLDLATWDNSGRLESETFHFDPQVADPLEHYWEGGRAGGGSRPRPPVLGDKPTEVTLALNEWARFDSPGKFRLFVESTRIEAESRPRATSNVVEIEIVNDPKWAATELARVRSQLATHRTDEEASSEARRSLRFLNTEGAARAMVDDLCGPDDRNRFQTELGLFASPYRQKVVTMLEEGLATPDCAITSSYLSTLTHVEVRDAGRREATERAFLAGLAGKKGPAATVSVQTALRVVADWEQREKKPHPMREQLRARIAGVFATLPEEALARMLETEWASVRSPAMAPTLRALVTEARPRGGQLRSISDLALERLLELDYDGARAFILSELARETGARVSFTGKTLGLLKDAELPDVNRALLSGLLAEEHDGATLELRSEVLARYASKAILDKVWPIYRGETYFHVSLLSYLSRHDPKGAEVAMRKIEDVDSLRRLSNYMWSPVLEAIVVQRLQTRDASTAARILSERGSAGAETALVDRWRELHASGADKERLGHDLQTALVRGRAWMVTPERLSTLSALCDDAMCKSDLEATAGRWGPDGKQPDLTLWSLPDGGLTGWFGHYDVRSVEELERRVKQLPLGFTIAMKTKPPDVDAALVEKVRAWAREKKLTVISP